MKLVRLKKERKEKHFIQKPTYPGGQNSLKKFITSQLKYPKEALKDKTEGTVFMRYDINYKGEVVDTHILSSLSKACDAEADRLVRLLKFEVPKTRKMKVLFHKKIQIHFKLPKPKKTTTSYQYTTTSTTTSKKEKSEIAPQTTYSYTIKINKQ